MSNSKYVNVVVPASPSNYTVGRSGRSIEAITIHHMAGRLTAEQCGKIFQDPNRKASSNYGIGYDGNVGLYVDECNTSWCNYNWDSNCKSVTIEVSDNDNSWYVNDTTMEMLIKLVADIGKRNNLGTLVKGKNVTWHSMFANTTCPGDYLRSKIDYICDEANKINNDDIYNKSIDELANEVIQGKYGNGEERKKALGDRYDEVQKRVNEILYGDDTSKGNLLMLVKRTMRGDFGNGEDRRNVLGDNYAEVQRQVNLNIEHGTTNWDNIRLY